MPRSTSLRSCTERLPWSRIWPSGMGPSGKRPSLTRQPHSTM
ncbi:hypothetical protein LEMLEM_LOCUS15099 [Lemmus lemmus]